VAVGIHAQGFIGIAFETTAGTYVPPTRFFPIVNETLTDNRDHVDRRVIRGLADNLDILAGYSHVEGDIEMELMESVLPYFLYVSRNTIVKSGSTDFTYTCTPTHAAISTTKPGLSITVTRAGVTFGYVGCIVSQMEFSLQDGIPHVKFSIQGLGEASQSLPTYTATATDTVYGADKYTIEIPTASQVFDCSDFTVTINDNAVAENRINGTTQAQFVRFGQREVTASITRDFSSRTEYDAWKNLTASSVNIVCTKGVNNSVAIKLANAKRDTYELDGLADQGTLHMAQIGWQGLYDTTSSKSYEIIVKCQESIT